MELALALPLVCLLLLAVVQVIVVARDRLAVQLAAREAARAASVAADPSAARLAAERAVPLRPLAVDVAVAAGAVTATVRHVNHTDVGLVGTLLPDVELSATVTMAVEPPSPGGG